VEKILPIVDPLHISGLAELEILYPWARRLTKSRLYGGRGQGARSRAPHLNFGTPISRMAEARHSGACNVCSAFDAAFAKLLRPRFHILQMLKSPVGRLHCRQHHAEIVGHLHT